MAKTDITIHCSAGRCDTCPGYARYSDFSSLVDCDCLCHTTGHGVQAVYEGR